MNHILSRKTDPDWKFAKLQNLGDAQAEGDGPEVARVVGLPVCQYIAGISDTPAIGQEISCDGLEIHLVRVSSISRTPEGRPVLDKGTN
jgi:hypothetical protein